MKKNKYKPFYRKDKGTWGIKNTSSKFEKNELKYIFSSKEETTLFIKDLLESERKRAAKEWKHISGGRYETQIRCELVFVVLKNFRYYG